MKNISTIIRTSGHLAGPIVRFTLAIVILPHGLQFLFGWFGGPGFSGAMDYLTHTKGLPYIAGVLVILLQVVGPLSFLAGFAGRLFALATGIIFFGMILTSHLDHGFFMNWSGAQGGEGFEYHILVIGLCLALLISGSGRASADRWITEKILDLKCNY